MNQIICLLSICNRDITGAKLEIILHTRNIAHLNDAESRKRNDEEDIIVYGAVEEGHR